MLKIAVAGDDKMISEHFGHCKEFIIFDTEDNQVISTEIVPYPGHRPGFLPNFLADLGIDVIISGGMGEGAITIFNQRNIEVIIGANGNVQDAVEAYLQGTLKSTGTICHEHDCK